MKFLSKNPNIIKLYNTTLQSGTKGDDITYATGQDSVLFYTYTTFDYSSLGIQCIKLSHFALCLMSRSNQAVYVHYLFYVNRILKTNASISELSAKHMSFIVTPQKPFCSTNLFLEDQNQHICERKQYFNKKETLLVWINLQTVSSIHTKLFERRQKQCFFVNKIWYCNKIMTV